MATREERRRAIETRRRRVRQQRLALAVAAALGCVVLALALLTGGGGGGRGGRGTPRQAGLTPKPALPRHPRPSPVDKVLLSTSYIVRGTKHKREVALTFDDGPSPFTPRLLKVLRQQHAPATFFPVGQPINAFTRYLKAERRGGFTIGDHTFSHPLMGHLPLDTQAGQIDQQAELLKRAHVPYPRLFRPPYGSFNNDTRALLQQRRMLMVLWDVNPQDYYRPGANVIVARVMAAVKPGSIVLMHDGGGDRSQTVAAVPLIISNLRRRGYRIVSVPRLLADDPPPRGQGPPPNLAGV